jgi:hypothetical protein
LNEEEKKGILLDEDKSSEEIDSKPMELINNFFLFFLFNILSFVNYLVFESFSLPNTIFG